MKSKAVLKGILNFERLLSGHLPWCKPIVSHHISLLLPFDHAQGQAYCTNQVSARTQQLFTNPQTSSNFLCFENKKLALRVTCKTGRSMALGPGLEFVKERIRILSHVEHACLPTKAGFSIWCSPTISIAIGIE